MHKVIDIIWKYVKNSYIKQNRKGLIYNWIERILRALFSYEYFKSKLYVTFEQSQSIKSTQTHCKQKSIEDIFTRKILINLNINTFEGKW